MALDAPQKWSKIGKLCQNPPFIISIFPVLVTFTTPITAVVKKYRFLMRKFLNNLENDKVAKLCSAAESDEKLFWKLLKGQRPSCQISAFLVKDKLITDKNLIREMWVNHLKL